MNGAVVFIAILMSAGWLAFLWWVKPERSDTKYNVGAVCARLLPYVFCGTLLTSASLHQFAGDNESGLPSQLPRALNRAWLLTQEIAVPISAGSVSLTTGANDSSDLWVSDLQGMDGKSSAGSMLRLDLKKSVGAVEVLSGRNTHGALLVSAWKLGDDAPEIANTYQIKVGALITAPALKKQWRVDSIARSSLPGRNRIALSWRETQGKDSSAWAQCAQVQLPDKSLASLSDTNALSIAPLRTVGGFGCMTDAEHSERIGQSFFSIATTGGVQFTLDTDVQLDGIAPSPMKFSHKVQTTFDAKTAGLVVAHFRVRMDQRLADEITKDWDLHNSAGEIPMFGRRKDASRLVPVLRYSTRVDAPREGRAVPVLMVDYRVSGSNRLTSTEASPFRPAYLFSLFAADGRRDQGAFTEGATMVAAPLGSRFRALTQDNSIRVFPLPEVSKVAFTWFGGKDSAQPGGNLGGTGRWLGDDTVGAVRLVAYNSYVPLWLGLVVLLAGVAMALEACSVLSTGPVTLAALLALEWLLGMRVLIAVQEAMLHGGTMWQVYSALALLWTLPVAIRMCSTIIENGKVDNAFLSQVFVSLPALVVLSLGLDLNSAGTAPGAKLEYLMKLYLPVILPFVLMGIVIFFVSVLTVGRVVQLVARVKSRRWTYVLLAVFPVLHLAVTQFVGKEQIAFLGGVRVSTIFLPLYVLMFAWLAFVFVDRIDFLNGKQSSRYGVAKIKWALEVLFCLLLAASPLFVWILAKDAGAAICFGLAVSLFGAALAARGDYQLQIPESRSGGKANLATLVERWRWLMVGCFILALVPLCLWFVPLYEPAESFWNLHALLDYLKGATISVSGAIALGALLLVYGGLLVLGTVKPALQTRLLLFPALVAISAASSFALSNSNADQLCPPGQDDKSFIECVASPSTHNGIRLQRLLAEGSVRAEATTDAISQTMVFDEMRHFNDSAVGSGFLNVHPRRYLDRFDGVFSEHVMQTFGRFGALGLLSLYVLVFALATLSLKRSTLSSSIALMAGSVFLGVTLYVFLSISGLLPFTGRNAYLLTAISFSDWIEGFTLLFLISAAAARDSAGELTCA